MTFEFIEDSFNYRPFKADQPSWFLGSSGGGFEHITKATNSTEGDEEGFEDPYTRDHDMMVRNHPMMVMAEYSCRSLLRHPLCLTLVRHKWMKFGRLSFFLILAMYLLFLASLTTYVVTSPNPILTPQFYNCTPYFHPNNTVNKTDVDNLFPFEKDSQVNDISRIVLIAIASLNLIWILIGGNFLILIKAFMNLDIWTLDLPWTIIINTAVFSMTLGAVCDNDYQLYYRPSEETSELRECPQWQLSAFVVTLAWVNLLIYMRQIPVLGKYITIFHDVLYTFLRVATIILVFVVAFALGFHALLAHEVPFATVQDSMLKVAIMMSGEIDYADIFLSEGPVPFKGATYVLFVVFFLLVCIITLNLLVGLTVDDIQSFLDEADLKNLKLKLAFVLGLEKQIPFFNFSWIGSQTRVQNLSLRQETGKMHVDDVVSKRRIWEQIINKSVDNLKKTEFQLLIEEQKAQKERLANIESALKAIEANLISKTDKK